MENSFVKARALLQNKDGNESSKYQAYLKHKNEYDFKVKIRNDTYQNAQTDPVKLQMYPIDGVAYQNEVDTAWDKWIALGFKYEIENAIAILEAQPKN